MTDNRQNGSANISLYKYKQPDRQELKSVFEEYEMYLMDMSNSLKITDNEADSINNRSMCYY